MDFLKLLALCLLLSSCAKISYLSGAGVGQFKLLYNAKDNEEILEDESVSAADKEKIQLIQTYKSYFYEYWNIAPTKTYSKTTMLNRDAVTYLVISSPKDRIFANEECFWFVGCFPYLGFFDYNNAKDYEQKMAKQGNDTYMRKVLAYSTLNRFSDPIISTFFTYNEYELAETVFHELFHTIFFVKNEVDLNENLANFFGKKMVEAYFGNSEKKSGAKDYLAEEEKFKALMDKILELEKEYRNVIAIDHSDVAKQNFINSNFLPEIIEKCNELGLKESCWPTKLNWNNATFAAFLTYEKGQDFLSDLYLKNDSNLHRLFDDIKLKYEQFLKIDSNDSFSKFLLQ